MAEDSSAPEPQKIQALKNSNSASDNEGAEKPVREQLKKTSIDTTSNGQSLTSAPTLSTERTHDSISNDTQAITSDSQDKSRSKRSREDDDEEADEAQISGNGRHGRKRSRDSDIAVPLEVSSDSAEDSKIDSEINGSSTDRSGTPPITASGEGVAEDYLASPKNKRTRAQFQKDAESLGPTNTEAKSATDTASTNQPIKITALEDAKERESKRPREEEEDNNKAPEIAPTSGFANTSSISPFAALGTASKTSAPTEEMQAPTIKDPKPVSSPFGSLGQSSGSSSPFGALTGGTKTFTSTTATTGSVFGGTNGTQSAFGSLASKSNFGGGGFGGFGAASSPFASAMTGKSGLSSFASSATTGNKPPILGLSSKPAKPFGAPLSDEEDDGGSDDDEANQTDVSRDIEQGIPSNSNEPKRDKRFVEQETETGEEHEHTLFSSRAKLYYFDMKESGWKERGVGDFRFNISRVGELEDGTEPTDESHNPRKARFIMRAEGSRRLLLNSALSKNTKFGDVRGQCPKGTTVLWQGVLEGHDRPVGLQLKMKADLISVLWEAVDAAKQDLS